MSLLQIDGSLGEAGGQVVRSALSLAAVTGQGFELKQIRAKRQRRGLRPQHVAAVRAAAMCCGARVGGVFEGSPDLRFEPGAVGAGDFRFEIGTAGATSLVLQTVLVPLATASTASHVQVGGGTHVPRSPSFDYLARHWAGAVARLGLVTEFRMTKAGFYPQGGGEVLGTARPWADRCRGSFETRGALLAVRGVSGASRVRGDLAARQRDGAQQVLWERQRLETEWELVEVAAAGPGSYVMLEAVYETGRAAFGLIGERGVPAERVGARAARRLLRFMEDEEGAVDPRLADQLVVPLALSGVGGCLTTPEVTSHLETVVEVARMFGVPVRLWGRLGGPGGVEVGALTPATRGDTVPTTPAGDVA